MSLAVQQWQEWDILRQKQRYFACFNSHCFRALFLSSLMAIDVRCSAALLASIMTAWAFYLFFPEICHPTPALLHLFQWRPFWKTGSKWIKIFAALKNWRFYNFLNSPISNSCCNTLTGGPWKSSKIRLKMSYEVLYHFLLAGAEVRPEQC